MAINFPSALDVLPKKEAVAEKLSTTSAEKIGSNKDVPKNCAASFDDVVRNTVVLFHAWRDGR